MKFLPTLLGLASVANAHTLFTTLFINGKNQGDGTCVRQPHNGDGKDTPSANAPIYPIDGEDMACGRIGNTPVNYVCPAPGGARLTFEFRISPSRSDGGAIAEGHKGPCSVYVKKVDDMFSTKAAGAGWFKIWEDGYNNKTDTWCVDTLIKNKGLLTVDLPTGLPSGYYLIRPEVLALHAAASGDPQFYTSCAQVFIENGPEGPLKIPSEYGVSIPGYVKKDDPGVTYNLYKKPLPEYSIPGPEVYIPTSSNTGTKQVQEDGVIPSDCLAKSANWCGKPIAAYSGQSECWAAAKECWAQGDTCWESQTPSGNANCHSWSDYCKKMNDACSNKQFDGPPKFTTKEIMEPLPGPIPAPYNNVFKRTDISSGTVSGGSDDKPAVSSASVTTVTTKAATKTAAQSEETDKPTKPDEVNAPSIPTSAQETDAASPTSVETSTPSGSEGGLKVSQDGRCGGTTGQTCLGSTFGDCCSKKGRCGRKTRHCACGCQPGFGECRK